MFGSARLSEHLVDDDTESCSCISMCSSASVLISPAVSGFMATAHIKLLHIHYIAYKILKV